MIQPIYNFGQTDEYFDKKNQHFQWGIAEQHETLSIFSTDKCNKKLQQKSLLRQQQVFCLNQNLGLQEHI